MELLEMKYAIPEAKKQHRWSEQQIRYFRRKYNSEFGDLEIETIEIKQKRDGNKVNRAQ